MPPSVPAIADDQLRPCRCALRCRLRTAYRLFHRRDALRPRLNHAQQLIVHRNPTPALCGRHWLRQLRVSLTASRVAIFVFQVDFQNRNCIQRLLWRYVWNPIFLSRKTGRVSWTHSGEPPKGDVVDRCKFIAAGILRVAGLGFASVLVPCVLLERSEISIIVLPLLRNTGVDMSWFALLVAVNLQTLFLILGRDAPRALDRRYPSRCDPRHLWSGLRACADLLFPRARQMAARTIGW